MTLIINTDRRSLPTAFARPALEQVVMTELLCTKLRAVLLAVDAACHTPYNVHLETPQTYGALRFTADEPTIRVIREAVLTFPVTAVRPSVIDLGEDSWDIIVRFVVINS